MIARYLRIRSLVVAFLFTAVPWLVNSVEAQEANARTQLILKGDPWVGQRVGLVVELLVPGFFSGTPHFDLPSVPGALLVSPSESPVLGSEQIKGVTFTVQRHEFSIFPHKAGEYRIPAFVIRLKFKPSPLDKEVISKTVHSEPVSFTTHFPPGTENLTGLLSAKQLQVTEKWQPLPGKAKAGDAFYSHHSLCCS